jgi:cbb3-type cytochrome oxidase subunit 3
MHDFTNWIGSFFTRINTLIKNEGFLRVFGVALFIIVFLGGIRFILSEQPEKIVEMIEENQKQEEKINTSVQYMKMGNIQSYLSALIDAKACDHNSVSIFHNSNKSLGGGKIEFLYSEIFAECSNNESKDSEMMGIQLMSRMPYYEWLYRNHRFQGTIEEIGKIDAKLKKFEVINGVKYIMIEMIFDDDGTPVGNVTYCWNEVPTNVNTEALEKATDLIRYQLIH